MDLQYIHQKRRISHKPALNRLGKKNNTMKKKDPPNAKPAIFL